MGREICIGLEGQPIIRSTYLVTSRAVVPPADQVRETLEIGPIIFETAKASGGWASAPRYVIAVWDCYSWVEATGSVIVCKWQVDI
jgi:hypothetical protein